MAKKNLYAQASPWLDGPVPSPTPYEAMGFEDPTEEIFNVQGQLRQPVDMPSGEPAPFNVMPPVSNAHKKLLELSTQPQAQDYLQQFTQMISSPEEQALKKEYEAASKAAIAEQQKGVSDNEAYLRSIEQKGPATNWTPLTSLVNSWTGSKLDQGYQSENPEAFQQKMFALKNQLQGQKKGVTDENLAMLKNKLSQMDMLKLIRAQQGNSRLDQRSESLGLMKDRMAADAVKAIDNHPIIQGAAKQLNQLQIDRHTIEQSPLITPQILHEISNGIANALGGGRSVGLGMAEMQDLSTSQTYFAALEQKLTNSPVEGASPAVKKQVIDTLNRLEEAYGKNLEKMSAKLIQGRTYDNNSQARRALETTAGKYKMPVKEAPHPIDQLSDEEVMKAYNKKMGIK